MFYSSWPYHLHTVESCPHINVNFKMKRFCSHWISLTDMVWIAKAKTERVSAQEKGWGKINKNDLFIAKKKVSFKLFNMLFHPLELMEQSLCCMQFTMCSDLFTRQEAPGSFSVQSFIGFHLETKQDPVGPSLVQKALCVPRFLFIGKKKKKALVS